MLQSSPISTGRRSVLCVPATDERVIGKALAAGADEVVIDLEDAVPAGGKDAARERLLSFDWSAHPRPRMLSVRVNAPGTPWFVADIETLVRGNVPVDSIVVPKVESRDDLRFAERLIDGLEREMGASRGVTLQALIETAGGVAGLPSIVAERDRLIGLIIGYADLAASLGRVGNDMSTWLPIQASVLVHARAAGVEAIDGPYLGVAVDSAFDEAVQAVAALGFDGKWVIHPRQIETVVQAFTPAEEATSHARRVLAALESVAADGRGALQLDGALIDEAMAVAARRVLAKVAG